MKCNGHVIYRPTFEVIEQNPGKFWNSARTYFMSQKENMSGNKRMSGNPSVTVVAYTGKDRIICLYEYSVVVCFCEERRHDHTVQG